MSGSENRYEKILLTLLTVALAVGAVLVVTKPFSDAPAVSSSSPTELSSEDIRVLLRQEEPTGGVYTDFLLCVGDAKLPFRGELLAERESPRVEAVDLTDDGHKEIVVIFQSDAGTGCYGEDVHVFDGLTLEEYAVVSPSALIDTYFKATTENGNHTVTIAGTEYQINTDGLVGYDPSDAEYFYIDSQYYAYRVTEQALILRISCGIWAYGPCGYLEVTLKKESASFVFSSAVYVPSGCVLT